MYSIYYKLLKNKLLRMKEKQTILPEIQFKLKEKYKINHKRFSLCKSLFILVLVLLVNIILSSI
jgi:hypothetical protein